MVDVATIHEFSLREHEGNFYIDHYYICDSDGYATGDGDHMSLAEENVLGCPVTDPELAQRIVDKLNAMGTLDIAWRF
jgi:hypothetical protein